jgi:Flp pilus assembly protein TadD
VPGDYSVRNSLGVHYVQLGRNDDARAQFLAALELSPDHAVAHYNLGLIAILGNRAGEAFTHLNKAIAVKPTYAEAHSNLGVPLDATAAPTRPSTITARRSSRGPTTLPRLRTSRGS